MSKSYEPVTIYHPKTGKPWKTESKEQEVNMLYSQGWSKTKPKQKQADAPANKSTGAPKNK